MLVLFTISRLVVIDEDWSTLYIGGFSSISGSHVPYFVFISFIDPAVRK